MDIRLIRLLAVVFPDRWAAELAEEDIQRELASSEPLRSLAPEDREARRKGLREATPRIYRELRFTLARALGLMLSAVVAGWILDVAVRCLRVAWPNGTALVAGLASLIILATATLGRLQWESWKRQTSAELADQSILRLLYWLGTFAGALALMTSR